MGTLRSSINIQIPLTVRRVFSIVLNKRISNILYNWFSCPLIQLRYCKSKLHVGNYWRYLISSQFSINSSPPPSTTTILHLEKPRKTFETFLRLFVAKLCWLGNLEKIKWKQGCIFGKLSNM